MHSLLPNRKTHNLALVGTSGRKAIHPLELAFGWHSAFKDSAQPKLRHELANAGSIAPVLVELLVVADTVAGLMFSMLAVLTIAFASMPGR